MRLFHVTLFVRDALRSRDFYRRLGFRLIVDSAPRYCRLRAPFGDATLSLHIHDGPIRPAAEIGLEFDSAAALDAEVARLQAAGFVFAHEPVDQPWLWREARLVDPDGHVLLFMYAGDIRLDPPWRVRESEP